MTVTPTPEDMAYVRDLIRVSLKTGAPGLAEPTREAIVRSIALKIEGKVIRPLLSDKVAASAELARLRTCGEALRQALDLTKAAADDLVPACIEEGDDRAAGALQFISGFVSDRLAAIENAAAVEGSEP